MSKIKPLILVVDDTLTNIDLLTDVLMDDYRLGIAMNGQKALAFVDRNPPDLILLDIMMPEMDGYEVCRCLKKNRKTRDIPVIFITAMSDTAHVAKGFDVGGVDYVTKPFHSLEVKARVKTHLILKNQLSMSARIFESSLDGIIVTDPDTVIQIVNPAVSEITGYSAEEMIGRKTNMLQSRRHDESFYQDMWNTLIEMGNWTGEIWNRKKNGEIYPQWLSITVIRDLWGRVTNYVGVFHDMSEMKRQQDELKYQASHDALTDLPNRHFFQYRLMDSMANAGRHGEMLAIMLLDLDNFKSVNDSLGHTTGDTLLQEVALRLLRCLGEGGFVSRLGGDEFAILLEDVRNEERAVKVAGQIYESISKPFHLKTHDFFLTVSIGITFCPGDGQDPETLLKNSDIAMFRAKQRGGNSYEIFTPAMDREVTRRLTLESQLRRAIERDELMVYYQPKLDLVSGCIVSMEALVRWQKPNEGVVSPAEFIPLAERTGLILPLGRWVLQTAALQTKKWWDAGYRLRVAVNLSPRQFQEENLLEMIHAVLAETGLPPAGLELEITESVVMENEEMSLELMAKMSAMGLHLALDDFGTGYSSLRYLKQFPINTLKIDKSFVDNVPGDDENVAITSAIISMARSLKMQVVAEGVETEEQLHFLRQLVCDEMQGYLFSPPVPADKFSVMLKENKCLPPY
ncbi:MAG: EAL domain-containing protein [Thermodesulfobacteriota bacterium]|nr:EAL domain-containing protein [Thermodesulfobacteriota bacterium]